MDNIKNDKYYINQILDDIDKIIKHHCDLYDGGREHNKIEEFIKDNI